ncbi:MAG: hypothetical protein JW937_06005 [Candidatus Omnitrophica bacterium]|nr:hypothetical protein [Candidatus Omnitrophota bacterium]
MRRRNSLFRVLWWMFYAFLFWVLLVAGASVYLSRVWLPGQGPQECSELFSNALHRPVQVGSVRISGPLSLELKDIRIEDIADPEDFLPAMEWSRFDLHVLPWAILSGQPGVRIESELVSPLEISPVLTFSVNWVTKDWTGSLQVPEISLPAAAKLSPTPQVEIRKGTADVRIQFRGNPNGLERLTGRILFFDLDAQFAAGEFSGRGENKLDLRFDAGAYDAGASKIESFIHEGAFLGIPHVGSVQNLKGQLELDGQQIRIHRLLGTLFGGPAEIKGTLSLTPQRQVFLDYRAEPTLEDLLPLAYEYLPLLEEYSPRGLFKVQGQMGGSLLHPGDLTLRSQILLENLELDLPERLGDETIALAGQIDLDYPGGELAFKDLKLSQGGQLFYINGNVAHLRAPEFRLSAESGEFTAKVAGSYKPPLLLLDQVSLQRGLSRFSLNGKMDLSGPRHVQLSGAGEVFRSDVDYFPPPVPLLLNDLSYQDGWKHQLQFAGELHNPQSWAGHYLISGRKMTWQDWDLGNVDIKILMDSGMLRVTQLSLNPYGGQLNVVGDCDFVQAGKPFQLQGRLDGVDLRLLAGTHNTPKTLEGTGGGEFYFRGSLPDRKSWTGGATLLARDGNLGELPVLDSIQQVIRLIPQMQNAGVITGAGGNFELHQERFYTQDLLLTSNQLHIEVQGSVGLDQTLDFAVNPKLSPNFRQRSNTNETVGQVLDVITGSVMSQFRVRGTVKEPKIDRSKPRIDQMITPLLKQLGR